MSQPECVYHIVELQQWRRAQSSSSYRPESLDSEGFIHCSIKRQLPRVIELFFKNQKNLLLLKIDTAQVKSRLQNDYVEDMDDTFAHIYGPLNTDAVIDEIEMPLSSDGIPMLPDDF